MLPAQGVSTWPGMTLTSLKHHESACQTALLHHALLCHVVPAIKVLSG